MAAPNRLGRFHLVPSGAGWCWIYISMSSVEICRSYVYQTKIMAYRGLLRFVGKIKKEVPEIRYKGFLNDASTSNKGIFAVKAIPECKVLTPPK